MSILIPAATISTFNFISDFRHRREIRELNRRFGRWPLSDYVRYYADHAPTGTMVCVFRAHTLPHGRSYWARLLFDHGGDSSAEIVGSCGRYFAGPDPWDDVEVNVYEVPTAAAAQIRSLIDKTKGTGNSEFESMIRDGFPAWLGVIFADHSTPTEITANLAGLSADQRSDDRIRLIMAVSSVICKEREFWSPDHSADC